MRLRAHFSKMPRVPMPEDRYVPMPLSATVWSQAVFRRPVMPTELFVAVMSDPAAALVAHGLAALDDDTLSFLAAHPTVVTWLYEEGAPVFAAFAAHVRIRDGRVVTPGGQVAVSLWEAVLNAKVTQPEAFVRELMARGHGRLAYLYDVIGHLDSSRTGFALGSSIEDPEVRVERFRALVTVAVSAHPEWNVRQYPFTRPGQDLMSMFSRVQVDRRGAPGVPASQTFWTRAFDTSDPFRKPLTLHERLDRGPAIDAAWLAEALVLGPLAGRTDRHDQFAFGHRAFATVDPAVLPDALVSVAAFPTYRMLMLTLERIGVARPGVYAAMARHAQRLSMLSGTRGPAALAQFQGALAIVDRLVRVRRLDSFQAEALVASLAAVPIDAERGYLGALAPWLHQQLGRTLGGPSAFDDLLLTALAGPQESRAPTRLWWEGQPYVFDLATSEAERLRRIHKSLPNSAIDTMLNLHRIANAVAANAGAAAARQAAISVLQRLSTATSTAAASTATTLLATIRDSTGPTTATWFAQELLELVDVGLADALLGFAYVAEWNARRGAARLPDVAQRHDFGFRWTNRLRRTRQAWAQPRLVSSPGVPWHIEGAAVGLDIALASLTLRRISSEALATAPVINSVEREGFITSLALLNAFTLQDSTRDAIATAVGRGQRRVAALDPDGPDLNAVVREVAMDGWRARALGWTARHDPQRIATLLSMTDLLHLGGGGHLDLNSWGMSALSVTGCLCLQMPQPGVWTLRVGRPHLGLLAATVADLNLRVAITLFELGLPAALAKSVLAVAVQEFVDETRPADSDDWLTFVRAARGLSRERIEDYVATAAFNGPLALETAEPRGR
jgi:hypothetical protein